MGSYSRQHRNLRATLLAQLRAGVPMTCWRCGELIAQDSPDHLIDLGHDDSDSSVWRGLEHRACNRATQTRGRATATRSGGLTSWSSRRW